MSTQPFHSRTPANLGIAGPCPDALLIEYAPGGMTLWLVEPPTKTTHPEVETVFSHLPIHKDAKVIVFLPSEGRVVWDSSVTGDFYQSSSTIDLARQKAQEALQEMRAFDAIDGGVQLDLFRPEGIDYARLETSNLYESAEPPGGDIDHTLLYDNAVFEDEMGIYNREAPIIEQYGKTCMEPYDSSWGFTPYRGTSTVIIVHGTVTEKDGMLQPHGPVEYVGRGQVVAHKPTTSVVVLEHGSFCDAERTSAALMSLDQAMALHALVEDTIELAQKADEVIHKALVVPRVLLGTWRPFSESIRVLGACISDIRQHGCASPQNLTDLRLFLEREDYEAQIVAETICPSSVGDPYYDYEEGFYDMLSMATGSIWSFRNFMQTFYAYLSVFNKKRSEGAESPSHLAVWLGFFRVAMEHVHSGEWNNIYENHVQEFLYDFANMGMGSKNTKTLVNWLEALQQSIGELCTDSLPISADRWSEGSGSFAPFPELLHLRSRLAEIYGAHHSPLRIGLRSFDGPKLERFPDIPPKTPHGGSMSMPERWRAGPDEAS
jgi:hypothetical protein